MLDYLDVFAMVGGKPLGVLPEDDFVNCYMAAKSGDNPYKVLATNLHEGTRQMYDRTSKYKGFFGKLRRNAKRNA
jgi:hypothetical protein